MSSKLAAASALITTVATNGANLAAVQPQTGLSDTAELPHNSKATYLMVSVWVLCAISFLFLALRIYCKLASRRGLWWDDHMLLASWIMVLANCSCVSYMVHLGYGKHSWDFNPANINSYVLAANIRTVFTVCAAAWSKTSFCLTLKKISGRRTTILLYAIIASINISLGLSALFPWVQCTPIQKGWKPLIPGKCWPRMTLIHYNMAAGAWSAAMDILLVVVPWKVILGLQMHLREKLGVAIAMSMGIL
ncbi:hypothetical protein TD95_005410 [Thielaviopsis punctulata]|uniref:Rhodopsin domain-containing protein n=1 Tax=Thielaviopsis punctulata TaxID=72032 RepID=A0A0F4ZGU4_9PEZI|nr:hypothetical protein TD95_005410 [Thielaviopsis punctulata]